MDRRSKLYGVFEIDGHNWELSFFSVQVGIGFLLWTFENNSRRSGGFGWCYQTIAGSGSMDPFWL